MHLIITIALGVIIGQLILFAIIAIILLALKSTITGTFGTTAKGFIVKQNHILNMNPNDGKKNLKKKLDGSSMKL